MLVGIQVSLFLLQLWGIEYMIEVSICFRSPLYFLIKGLVAVINEKFFFFKFCYQEWISNIMFAFL
jgi:hypothetical protein